MATTNLKITDITNSQNSKEVTANTAHDELDRAMNNRVEIGMGDANVVLSSAEGGNALTNAYFRMTGANTAQRDLLLPNNVTKFYAVENATTGGFPIRVKYVSLTPAVLVEPGEIKLIYASLVDVVAVSPATFEALDLFVDGTVVVKSYVVELDAKFNYDIKEATHQLGAGTGTTTFSVEINGVAVTGLAGLNTTTTKATATAAALNSVAPGDKVTINVTAVGTAPADLGVTLKVKRT